MMKRHVLCLLLHVLLIAFALSASLAFAQRPAPYFSVQTLDGQTLTSDSLRGETVLLQLWATWCGYCKSDQHAVDSIAAEYGSKGVSVVAVDVGESEDAIREYLKGNPRSCTVAIDTGHSVAAQFGSGGIPHYIVIDRNGNLVASRSGAIGEQGLRSLVERGLSSKGTATQTAERTAPQPSGGASPLMINVPGAQSSIRAKPIPKTIFVLASGEQLESDHYVISGGFVDVTVDGQPRHIALTSLNTQKTLVLNHQRGVELKIPANKSEVFLGF